MYNADSRAQAPALYAPNEQPSVRISATPAPRQRTPILRAILEALSWLGEIRAMPFVGLEPGSWRDEQPNRYY